MFAKCFITSTALGWMIAFSVGPIGPSDAAAQALRSGNQHGAHDGHDHSRSSAMQRGGAPMAPRPPHGGQMTVVGPIAFEVVYRPKETRVYFYQAEHRPISARGAQGRLTMTILGTDMVYPFPLAYVAPKAGSTEHDYLRAAVDVSRVRDGSMTVAFELANLPNLQQPRAAFTQTFALSELTVRVVSLDDSDGPRITAQGVCAVTGGRLGSMGTPVKMLIGEEPVYLCCKGCQGKVEKNPQAYLAKAAELRASR